MSIISAAGPAARRGLAATVTAFAVAAAALLAPAANAAAPGGSAVDLLIRDTAGTPVEVGALNPWNDEDGAAYLVDSVEGATSPAWATPAGAAGEIPVVVTAGDEKPEVASDGSTSLSDVAIADFGRYRTGVPGGDQNVLSGSFDAEWFEADGSVSENFHALYTSGALQAGTVYSLAYLSVGEYDSATGSFPVIPDPATVADGVGTPVASWLHFTVSADGFTVVDPAETTAAITTVTGIPVSGFRQTIVAKVAGAAAGTVTFRDGDTVLGTATVHDGKAKLTVKLKAGVRHLTAHFAPEDVAAYWPSTSPVKTVTIYKLF